MSQYTFNFEESDKRCTICGKYDECVQFGPFKRNVCYSCMRKHPKFEKKTQEGVKVSGN